jgi:hypothetical protein
MPVAAEKVHGERELEAVKKKAQKAEAADKSVAPPPVGQP